MSWMNKQGRYFVFFLIFVLATAISLCCMPTSVRASTWSYANEPTMEPTVEVIEENYERPAHVQAYLDTYAPLAQWVQRELGIFASVTLVQGGIESGWGQHLCGGQNLYGIKGSYDGAYNVCSSNEYENGEYVSRDSAFCAYPSLRHSFFDHAWFLCRPKYEMVRTARTYQEACRALQDAGYATSHTYAADLERIIADFRLYEYDLPLDTSRGETRIQDPARALQRALKSMGYDLGPCGIDGIVGPATRRAVRAFQKDMGMVPDGVAGTEVWERLMEETDAHVWGGTYEEPLY